MSEGSASGLCPEARAFLDRLDSDGSRKCTTKRQRERIRAYILAAAPNRDAKYYELCEDDIVVLFRMRFVMEDRAAFGELRTTIVNEICSEEGPPQRMVTVAAVEPRRGPTTEAVGEQGEVVRVMDLDGEDDESSEFALESSLDYLLEHSELIDETT